MRMMIVGWTERTHANTSPALIARTGGCGPNRRVGGHCASVREVPGWKVIETV
jgi:hypothetical protein